ncbi:MAG: hypothetical protein KDJ62_15955 [Rhodobiaceae bacterium]|nr:hypothetical protein [Rhodobiaceae bacterium]
MIKASTFGAAIATVMAATFIAAPAHAETKLRGVGIVSNQHSMGSLPRLVAVRSGGKLVLKDQQVNIPVRVGGRINNTSKKYVISFANVRSGDGARMDILRRGSLVRSIDNSLMLPFRKKHYGAMGSNALKACNGYNGAKSKVIGFSFPLILEVGAYKNNGDPIEVGSPFHSRPEAVTRSAKANIQAEVICPAAERPNYVTSVNLKIERKNASCPMKVILSASIQAERAGDVVDLMLVRNDGNKMKIKATARKVGSHFIAQFKKGYTFDRGTVHRKYRIETSKGSPWTDWVAMDVNCKAPMGMTN